MLRGTAGYIIVAGCLLRSGISPPIPTSSSRVSPAIAAVSLSVPAALVPVRAAGHTTLVYELHVANLGTTPLRLARLEVLADSVGDGTPIVAYSAREIERNTKLLAPRGAPTPKALTTGV